VIKIWEILIRFGQNQNVASLQIFIPEVTLISDQVLINVDVYDPKYCKIKSRED